MSDNKARLGDALCEAGIISADQLRIALTEQKRTDNKLGSILVTLGFISEKVLRDFISNTEQQESIDLAHLVADPEALAKVPQTLARAQHLLPISFNTQKQELKVAMSNVFDVIAIDKLNASLGDQIKITPLLAGERDIMQALDTAYGFDLSIDGILHELETGEIDAQMAASQQEYSQPLVRLVNALLADAVKRGASDIHFEPEATFLRIRYRIDGVLQQVRSLHKNYWSAIVVRIKVMAGLNIAETRIPQDGRISMVFSGQAVDFRVSSLPTIHGENIVLRILDREKGILTMQQLGLPDDSLQLLQLMMARPEGIILLTGPTGSGKTTTLYSLLNHLNQESVNIMTLEDPVEYQQMMLRQTAVNESVKLDFSTGIRALLRQDPDILLIGEIRDEDTAEMAFRAAMTGHQVYSTLHTNSAISAITRLLDIGVLPDILADNIIGIVGQRLLRKLCPHCKQAYSPTQLERHLLKLDTDESLQLYSAQGCDRCYQGYKGRLALLEILRIDDILRGMIAARCNIHELRHKAQDNGFFALADDGIRRVREGITSLDELTRVVDLTHHLH